MRVQSPCIPFITHGNRNALQYSNNLQFKSNIYSLPQMGRMLGLPLSGWTLYKALGLRYRSSADGG